MRVMLFADMLIEYGVKQLDPVDESDRKEMLMRLPFSVIVEGDHMEMENLEKWISVTFGKEKISYLYYGKIGYDFGFAEYFFQDQNSVEKTIQVVPLIYTIYPHSISLDKARKSVGFENEVVAEPNDQTAIIFNP